MSSRWKWMCVRGSGAISGQQSVTGEENTPRFPGFLMNNIYFVLYQGKCYI